MNVDKELLSQFEQGLNPNKLENSIIPAKVLGYGEISTIFKIDKLPELAFKRMPLFADFQSAKNYAELYRQYCSSLTAAGVTLPESETIVVQTADGLVVLYIVQRQLPAGAFGHKLIHSLENEKNGVLIKHILGEIDKVWAFNQSNDRGIELSIDGQISNWAVVDHHGFDQILFVDTSTPLFRIEGTEQMDPELILQSAPSFLRWIIRWLFLDDVMNRYYNRRQVYIDLAANLFKEQRPDLVPVTVAVINEHLSGNDQLLTVKEVKKYYREDKLIWILFLAFRRLDRWINTKILRQRYEFILPGKIKR